jgi:beta-mannosidase
MLDRSGWLPATVPGTYAAALRAAGAWNGEPPLELHQYDIWYRTRFTGGADEILHFQGLATIAEVWLNGELLLSSDNMFLAHHVHVRTGALNDLHIRFRSLDAWLAGRRSRAHWRPRLVSPSNLRLARITLLGHMPGWCPVVHPVGPWRPVLRERRVGWPVIETVDVRTSVVDRAGRVVVRAVVDSPSGSEAVAELAGERERLHQTGPNEFSGDITVRDAARWWPHTHGDPTLYSLTLRIDETRCDLGAIGVRSVERDAGDDGCGFGVRMNGETMFCRGACWTNPDVVALPSDTASYRPWLIAMRDAGMNMVRVGGTMLYEADEFYSLCDELGLLVWQDAMLANFDYPADESFRASLAIEISQFLDRTQAHPSLAVFCGGSEVLQQASMLGVPAGRVDTSLYTELIPELVRERRPDIVYVPNSPSGGGWPFQPDTEVTHYYGVGAYRRPLEDGRRANVRFAAECLALANVPCAETVEAMRVATISAPRWKRAIPCDPGAGWDFEDVRDHYLATLFAVDPAQLRWSDFQRYLELSRAVSCVLAEQLFGEWRRVGSTCAGGLVWQLQDLTPGAGWGVIDANGRPKPVWHALRRAFRPRQVILTDEGLSGLHVHVLNETNAPLDGLLRLRCLKEGRHPVHEGEVEIHLDPRGAVRQTTAALLPTFFDITYAYRFGPRIHDVTMATLHDARDDSIIAEAVHFPGGPNLPLRDVGLEAEIERTGGRWWLRLRSQAFASFVHIVDAAYMAENDWLHLRPGAERAIALRPLDARSAAPAGEIRALNSDRAVRYVGRT